MPRARSLFALIAVAAAALTALAGGSAASARANDCGPLPPLLQTPLLPCIQPPLAVPVAVPAPLPSLIAPTGRRQLLLRLAPIFQPDQLEPLLAPLGATLDRSLPQIRVVSISVPEATADLVAAALRRNPAIEEVEPEQTFSLAETTPNDAHWTSQWGLKLAGFTRAWDVTRGSRRILVAVPDTGVERAHPDLRGTVLPGHDFVADDDDPADENGHGTAVAGIIAAHTNNRAGVAGACWKCRILPVRVLGKDGNGDSATLAAGILWAVDRGADVINLSLGGRGTTMAERGAIAYAADHDVAIVAAAGNDGTTRREYPAAGRSVIAVAATDASDQLYRWSNRGAWIDVAAPGCNTAPWRGQTYATFCGTSSATPLVAGLVALVRAAHPDATAGETARLVRAAARPVSAAAGAGRADAARALPAVRKQRPAGRPAKDRLVTRVVASLRRGHRG
jgi:thermitase